ncbi:MAG: peptide chain release factor N(5)-glutamine methyltransferase [candidate division FCPU426 bacterium]
MQQAKSIQIPDSSSRHTLQAWLLWATHKLSSANVEAARQNAVELLAHAGKLSKAKVLAGLDELLPKATGKAFVSLISARSRRVPLQYLLGSEYFDGLTLKTGRGVLIPRPETELILEEAKRRLRNEPRLLLDVGTGSGNLALALAVRYPRARVWGLDRSGQALAWAVKNRRLLRLGARVRLCQGTTMPQRWHGKMDLVVSNPPYIPSSEVSKLQPEVRFEPRLALDGGPDGLTVIRRLLPLVYRLLRPGGLFVCEIGISQKAAAWKLFAGAGFSELEARLDWQQIPRVLSGYKPA